MIDPEALFTISYGLYIVCSGDREMGNGFISNTFFQVTAEPPKFASCCNKNNLTAEFIRKTGAFSVSVLQENADPELIGRFGYKSGRDIDKLDGMHLVYGETGVPAVLNDSIALLECRVTETFDVGTHLMFIGELVSASLTGDNTDPLTYLHYRRVRKGLSPKNAPTYIDPSKIEQKPAASKARRYQCTACGYIYDEAAEAVKFADLPAGWICPVCGCEKEDFIEI